MGEALERIVDEVVRRVAHQAGAERGEGVDLAGLGENVGEIVPRLHVVEGQRRLDCDALVNVGLGDTECSMWRSFLKEPPPRATSMQHWLSSKSGVVGRSGMEERSRT